MYAIPYLGTFRRYNDATLCTGYYDTATGWREMDYIAANGRDIITMAQLSIPLGTPRAKYQIYYRPDITGGPTMVSGYGYAFKGKGSNTGEGQYKYTMTGSPLSSLWVSLLCKYFGPRYSVRISVDNFGPGVRFGTNSTHWGTRR